MSYVGMALLAATIVFVGFSRPITFGRFRQAEIGLLRHVHGFLFFLLARAPARTGLLVPPSGPTFTGVWGTGGVLATLMVVAGLLLESTRPSRAIVRRGLFLLSSFW